MSFPIPFTASIISNFLPSRSSAVPSNQEIALAPVVNIVNAAPPASEVPAARLSTTSHALDPPTRPNPNQHNAYKTATMAHQQQPDTITPVGGNPVGGAEGNPGATGGSSGRNSAASTLLEPKTYIDPNADVVLRSSDGRDFRVNSYMLKANSDKLRDVLASQTGTITINADRKALKLFLDMIHYVPMPGSYVWSMRERLFPLIAELESKSAMERALSLCLDCPQRDPWGMFVAAGKHNFIPLARVALWELAREEEVEHAMMLHMRGVGVGVNGSGNGHHHFGQYGQHQLGSPGHQFGMSHVGTPGQFPGQFPGGFQLNQQLAGSPSMPSLPSSPVSMASKRSAHAVPAPSLHTLTAANLEGVPPAFMAGLLNAVMAASKDGAPLTWASVAARFEPVLTEERQPGKKAQKRLLNQQHHHQQQFAGGAQFQQHNGQGNPNMQGGAGLGLHLDSKAQHQNASFAEGKGKQQQQQQQMMGRKGGLAGQGQGVGVLGR